MSGDGADDWLIRERGDTEEIGDATWLFSVSKYETVTGAGRFFMEEDEGDQ